MIRKGWKRQHIGENSGICLAVKLLKFEDTQSPLTETKDLFDKLNIQMYFLRNVDMAQESYLFFLIYVNM